LYIEALDDYVKVVTITNSYLVNDTLKSLQEELPAANFIRVHKSFIIAKNKIVFFEATTLRWAQKISLLVPPTAMKYLCG